MNKRTVKRKSKRMGKNNRNMAQSDRRVIGRSKKQAEINAKKFVSTVHTAATSELIATIQLMKRRHDESNSAAVRKSLKTSMAYIYQEINRRSKTERGET